MQDREFDVCVIGTGITGSLAADHFLSKGASVVMLDRSKDVYLPANRAQYWHERWAVVAEKPNIITRNTWKHADKYFDDLAVIENIHKSFAFYYNMKYGLGGSGAVWSGAAWRFTPDDFSTQSHFSYGRDWPFTYEMLAPYYARVEELFGTSGPKDLPGWPWQNNYTYPAFKQSYLDKLVTGVLAPEYVVTPSPFSVKNLPPSEGGCLGAKNCVSHCPANARFRPDTDILYPYIKDNNSDLTLIMDTPCLKLNLSRDKRIKSAEVLFNGKSETIKAKYFYLAANTIENLRILLNSADNNQGEVANSSGLLGSYFASHGAVATSATLDEPVYIGRGRPTTSSVINTLNHDDRINTNAFMMEIWNTDWHIGLTPVEVFKNIRTRERHWGRALFDKVKQADNRFALTFIYEIEMRKRNKVRLSSRKDKKGLRVASVDFKLGERDKKTFAYMKKLANQLEAREGVSSIDIKGFGLNGNHPMGGYVSGTDPTASVVDEWMRSHDHHNLYILGGGAFNSTSALNPTHTIASLALKALDDPRLDV